MFIVIIIIILNVCFNLNEAFVYVNHNPLKKNTSRKLFIEKDIWSSTIILNASEKNGSPEQKDVVSSEERIKTQFQMTNENKSKVNTSSSSSSSPNQEFEALDAMLDKARGRLTVALIMAKAQALFSVSAFPETPLQFLKRSDVMICVLAILPMVGAQGFAIGYIVGKATEPSLRQMLPRGGITPATLTLLQLWPVSLAILLDQLIDF